MFIIYIFCENLYLRVSNRRRGERGSRMDRILKYIYIYIFAQATLTPLE